MHGFSTVDGFVEISEDAAEMIKYVANEPSVGLFYIQQHTQNAVPNVISLKNSVEVKSHETNLHTEDLEDSIAMVRSMKDFGPQIADDMIGDIKKSLAIMSAKQPKKGLISSQVSGFSFGRSSSFGPASWSQSQTSLDEQQDASDKRDNYFSSVLKSAKKKASNFKWAQIDAKDAIRTIRDTSLGGTATELLTVATSSSSSTLPEPDSEELPLSSRAPYELHDDSKEGQDEEGTNVTGLSEEYESFKAKREAKLEEWLEGNGKQDECNGAEDS